MHERLRLRFLSALGVSAGALACGREAPTPEPINVTAPTATASNSPSATSTPIATNTTSPTPSSTPTTSTPPAPEDEEELDNCLPANSVQSQPRNSTFKECAATIQGKCCGPAGGRRDCIKPLREERTTAMRTKHPSANYCCYQQNETRCRGRALRSSLDGAPIVAGTSAVGTKHVDRIDYAKGEEWLRAAADEHASIASFSIVSLQLMALGAPSDLIEATHRAALDEIEHTKICLALASKHLGEEHVMAPLAVPAFTMLSQADLARATFRDACVSETIAAMKVRDDSRVASERGDERHAALLTRVADDEERHAELGFRTVAWLVSTNEEARSAIREELDRLASTSSSAHDAIIRDVVLPCGEALLALKPSKAFS